MSQGSSGLVHPDSLPNTNTGIAIYRFRNGRIVENWLETDRLGALQQLGAVPGP